MKQVSASSFRLKGSGWYETDFKTGKKKNGVAEGGNDSAAAATGGGDTAATTKDAAATAAKDKGSSAGTSGTSAA